LGNAAEIIPNERFPVFRALITSGVRASDEQKSGDTADQKTSGAHGRL
jgi:hypothetical protein